MHICNSRYILNHPIINQKKGHDTPFNPINFLFNTRCRHPGMSNETRHPFFKHQLARKKSHKTFIGLPCQNLSLKVWWCPKHLFVCHGRVSPCNPMLFHLKHVAVARRPIRSYEDAFDSTEHRRLAPVIIIIIFIFLSVAFPFPPKLC